MSSALLISLAICPVPAPPMTATFEENELNTGVQFKACFGDGACDRGALVTEADEADRRGVPVCGHDLVLLFVIGVGRREGRRGSCRQQVKCGVPEPLGVGPVDGVPGDAGVVGGAA